MDLNNHNLKTVVYQRLEAIASAEKVTRVELAEISRELLIYVPETNDIEIVNRLLGVLTPMNRATAILYFAHFLPWEQEKNNDGVFQRFGKKIQGDKKVARKLTTIAEFLKDTSNNIWTWADKNIEIKKKDFAATITRAIKKALEGDEKSDTPPLSVEEVCRTVLSAVSVVDMLAVSQSIIDAMEAEKAEQSSAPEEAAAAA